MKANLRLVKIFTQEIDIMRSFYVDVLGLEVLEENPGDRVLLDTGACPLCLYQSGDEYFEAVDVNLDADKNIKLVFDIEDDIFALHANLVANGTLVTEIRHSGNDAYYICEGKDPEENIFQLKQKRP